MSRLFTFGCSFTNYRWSTWADILAPEFGEFYNWGQRGAGNHFIFNSVMEADQQNNFKDGDTVIENGNLDFQTHFHILRSWKRLK
jgi:hypothetical protein